MSHKPILIENLSLSFPHKTCFENFSTVIHNGDHIAIIGRNGTGKSTLLKMIKTLAGEQNLIIKNIEQLTDSHGNLSGGESFNQRLMEALQASPDILLLDEPTNHLDKQSRKNLMRNLEHFPGSIIVVSHDIELLQKFHILWHIDNGFINIFAGNYNDYMRSKINKYNKIEHELALLNREKKSTHESLMKEQSRSKKSRMQGEKHIKDRKWPTMVSHAKAKRAEETSGNKKSSIEIKKQELSSKLSDLRLPEIIKPKFSLTSKDVGYKNLVHITEGVCGYEKPMLQNITLSVFTGQKLALIGNNGSGKSTLVKAILNDSSVTKSGNWFTPNKADIGYLDQNYNDLNKEISVIELMKDFLPDWSDAKIRCHLNDFLFRKNDEVNASIKSLSGGEKARLSLSKISAIVPKLLILDEVTNNLDIETRQHVIEVLRQYPGAFIVISHDEDFLKNINITNMVDIKSFSIRLLA